MTRTLLAIESSTDWLSVALLHGEEIVALREDERSRQHASALLPAIDGVLREARVELGGLDAIGIAVGPGSFTSLRIGLATVKGLGFGRSIEAIGVSTLEAMALSVLDPEPPDAASEVVALLDARRGEWYAGGWSSPVGPDRLPRPTLPEGLYSPGALAGELSPGSRLMTPESPDWRREFESVGVDLVDSIDGRAARPRADWVGRLAERRLEAGQGVAVASLEARYLRRAEAEAKRLGGPVEAGEVARVEQDPG